MKRIKRINELFFDNDEIDDGTVRFYLLNTDTNKGFAFNVNRDDMKDLEEILKRNNVVFEIDDGANLPF